MQRMKAQALVVARLAWLGRAELARQLIAAGAAGGSAVHAVAALLLAEARGAPPAPPPEVLLAWYPEPPRWSRPREHGEHATAAVLQWLERHALTSEGVGDTTQAAGARKCAADVLEALGAPRPPYELDQAERALEGRAGDLEGKRREVERALADLERGERELERTAAALELERAARAETVRGMMTGPVHTGVPTAASEMRRVAEERARAAASGARSSGRLPTSSGASAAPAVAAEEVFNDDDPTASLRYAEKMRREQAAAARHDFGLRPGAAPAAGDNSRK